MTSVLSNLHTNHFDTSRHMYNDYDHPRATAAAMSTYTPMTPSFSSQHLYQEENLFAAAPAYGTQTSDLESSLVGLAAIADSSAVVDSVLCFPALPADLLDEAPEYEFSTHTRTNVFQDPSYGTDFATLGFAQDGLSYLDQNGHYALWSDEGSAEARSAAVNMGYLDDSNLIAKSVALPRSVDYFVSPSRQTFDLGRSEEPVNNSADYQLTRPAVFAQPSGENRPTSAEVPSVLYPGPAPGPEARPSLAYDTMYESQAGPSRVALRRPHDDAHSANSSPYGRSAPQPRFFGNGTLSHSPTDNRLEQRRMSAGGRTHARDPVVPSQNVGRQRMMSWQQERMQAMTTRDPAFPQPDSVGNNLHASDSAAAMYGAHPAMMTASRSYGYDLPHVNSSFLSQQNPDSDSNDMINALGDAMDARIDVDGIAKCPYPNCTKTFAKNRSYNLKAHLRSHSQVKPFSCTACPRSFSRKHDLERHARVHSGDKPYLCEFCQKGFPRSDALRRHWRVEKECGDKEAALESGHSLGYGDNNGRSSYTRDNSPGSTPDQQSYQQQKQGTYRPYPPQQQQWTDAAARQ